MRSPVVACARRSAPGGSHVRRAIGWQTLFRHETESKDRTRQLGEIKMAIQNIYIRTRQRGPYPESNKQFLDAIQQRIIDYQAIVTGHDRPLAQFAVLKQPPPRQATGGAAHAAHEEPAAPARGS
eukprot:909911-Prymnesium_polylepis.2